MLNNRWLLAARVHTLPLSIAPMIIANILAYRSGVFSFKIAISGTFTAILLQIVANLANDYGDAHHGTDAHRSNRMIATGKISIQEMKYALMILCIITIISGLWLLHVAFPIHDVKWFVLLTLGAFSLWAAIFYTVGDVAYGYRALGDVAVFLCFGLIAVAGMFFLQTNTLTLSALQAAFSVGLWCTAVLHLNNMRDLHEDKLHGKITLAVKMGTQYAPIYYDALLVISALLWLYSMHIPVILWVFCSATYHLKQFHHHRHDQTFYDQQIAKLGISLLMVSMIFYF